VAFDYTAGITYAKATDLLMPAFAQNPLRLALRNTNYFYRYHSPPLLSVAYCTAGTLTRACIYHIPIVPSSDGLLYDFEHRYECSNAAQTITTTVDYCTVYAGGATVWTNLYAQADVTGGAAVVFRSTRTGVTIPRTAVAIRVQYSAPAAGTRTDHHVLMYPNTQSVVAGVTTSGFIPWDDGALTSAEGFAIHEEHLNRIGKNAAYILQDRKQCAFAFVQEYTATPRWQCSDTYFGQLGYEFPPVRCYLPQLDAGLITTLTVQSIATVSAGTTTRRVSVAQTNGAICSMNASGNIEATTLDVSNMRGGLDQFVDLQLIPNNSAANTTTVYAVVAWYTPPVDSTNVVLWNNPAPIAASQVLAAACNRIQKAAVLPYVGTGHLFDGVTSTITSRTLAVRIAPGAVAARYAVSETGSAASIASAFQSHNVTCNTMVGKTSTLPWTMTLGGVTYNLKSFGPIKPINSVNEATKSEPYSLVGFVTGETALQLTTQNSPYSERVTVTDACGFSMCVSRQITDFETL